MPVLAKPEQDRLWKAVKTKTSLLALSPLVRAALKELGAEIASAIKPKA